MNKIILASGILAAIFATAISYHAYYKDEDRLQYGNIEFNNIKISSFQRDSRVIGFQLMGPIQNVNKLVEVSVDGIIFNDLEKAMLLCALNRIGIGDFIACIRKDNLGYIYAQFRKVANNSEGLEEGTIRCYHRIKQ